VTVVIGGAGTYDCQNIPTDPSVGPGVYGGREGNLFDFKRLVQGAGILLTDSTDRITIALSELAANTDLYVPASYSPLPPGTPPSALFATIQAAHDYLKQFRIPAGIFANIHVDAGVNGVPIQTVTGNGILFDHPDSKQINLIGKPRIDRTITAVSYVNTTQKDVACANTGLSVGQPVYLYGVNAGWVGGAKIVSFPAGVVRLSILNRSGLTPYNINEGSGTGKRLSWLPTIVAYSGSPAPGQNVLTCPNGIGSIQNIAFVGGYYTLALTGGGALTAIMCMSPLHRGLSLGTGDFSLNGECVFSDSPFFGITGVGSLQAYDQTMINGNADGIYPGAVGFAIGSIGAGQPLSIVYISHNLNGIHAVTGGRFTGGSIAYLINGTGMRAEQGSIINISAGSNPSEPSGNTLDLYAQGGSLIQYQRGAGVLPTCNPTADSLQTVAPFNNQLGFIHLI
jgi:hypothetical protein